MDVQHVTAYARERLGMEIQAVTHLGARLAGTQRLEVWSLMTEHGWFWLVEGAGAVELFRSVHHGPPAVAEATRRFLELHPIRPAQPAPWPPLAAETPAVPQLHTPRPRAAPVLYDCRSCGVGVVTRRGSVLADRQLCKQCRHAECERVRYQNDPEARARRRAYNAAYYQRSREGGGS